MNISLRCASARKARQLALQEGIPIKQMTSNLGSLRPLRLMGGSDRNKNALKTYFHFPDEIQDCLTVIEMSASKKDLLKESLELLNQAETTSDPVMCTFRLIELLFDENLDQFAKEKLAMNLPYITYLVFNTNERDFIPDFIRRLEELEINKDELGGPETSYYISLSLCLMKNNCHMYEDELIQPEFASFIFGRNYKGYKKSYDKVCEKISICFVSQQLRYFFEIQLLCHMIISSPKPILLRKFLKIANYDDQITQIAALLAIKRIFVEKRNIIDELKQHLLEFCKHPQVGSVALRICCELVHKVNLKEDLDNYINSMQLSMKPDSFGNSIRMNIQETIRFFVKWNEIDIEYFGISKDAQERLFSEFKTKNHFDELVYIEPIAYDHTNCRIKKIEKIVNVFMGGSKTILAISGPDGCGKTLLCQKLFVNLTERKCFYLPVNINARMGYSIEQVHSCVGMYEPANRFIITRRKICFIIDEMEEVDFGFIQKVKNSYKDCKIIIACRIPILEKIMKRGDTDLVIINNLRIEQAQEYIREKYSVTDENFLDYYTIEDIKTLLTLDMLFYTNFSNPDDIVPSYIHKLYTEKLNVTEERDLNYYMNVSCKYAMMEERQGNVDSILTEELPLLKVDNGKAYFKHRIFKDYFLALRIKHYIENEETEDVQIKLNNSILEFINKFINDNYIQQMQRMVNNKETARPNFKFLCLQIFSSLGLSIERLDLTGTNFNKNIGISVSHGNFRNSCMNEIDLYRCKFANCDFSNSNFLKVQLNHEEQQNSQINKLAISDDNELIAIFRYSSLKVFELNSNTLIFSMEINHVNGIKFLKQLLVIFSSSNEIWDVSQAKRVYQFHTSVFEVACSDDMKYLATGRHQRIIIRSMNETDHEDFEIAFYSRRCNFCFYKHTLFYSKKDTLIEGLNVSTKTKVLSLKTESSLVSLFLSINHGTLGYLTEKSMIGIINLGSNSLRGTYCLEKAESINFTGKKDIICLFYRGNIIFFNVKSQKYIASFSVDSTIFLPRSSREKCKCIPYNISEGDNSMCIVDYAGNYRKYDLKYILEPWCEFNTPFLHDFYLDFNFDD